MSISHRLTQHCRILKTCNTKFQKRQLYLSMCAYHGLNILEAVQMIRQNVWDVDLYDKSERENLMNTIKVQVRLYMNHEQNGNSVS